MWISWILACISSPAFAMLVNGERTNWFKSTKDLQQAPYLFIIGMEILTRSVKMAAEVRTLLDILLKRGE